MLTAVPLRGLLGGDHQPLREPAAFGIDAERSSTTNPGLTGGARTRGPTGVAPGNSARQRGPPAEEQRDAAALVAAIPAGLADDEVGEAVAVEVAGGREP